MDSPNGNNCYLFLVTVVVPSLLGTQMIQVFGLPKVFFVVFKTMGGLISEMCNQSVDSSIF